MFSNNRKTWTFRSSISSLELDFVGMNPQSDHIHVGEVHRSLALLQELFNPYFVLFNVKSFLHHKTSEVSSVDIEKIEDKLWRFYVERIAVMGLSPSTIFNNIDVCFVCAWLSGDEKFAPFFDSKLYSLRNADVAIENPDPLSHWLLHGLSDGRNPCLALKISSEFRESDRLGIDLSKFDNASAFLRTFFEINSDHHLDALLHSFYHLKNCGCGNLDNLENQDWCLNSVDRLIWSI